MAESASGGSVGTLVLKGVRWKFVSQIVVQLTRVAAGLAIARALSPGEYGLAFMVVAFSGFVLAFSDLAFGAALVQRKEITERDRSTVFWTTIAAGALCTGLGLLLAHPIASFYGEPRVRVLFTVFSGIFFLSSLGATHQALLTREMNFRGLEVRSMISSFAGGIVGVATALSGFGPWAIILQQLTIVSVGTAALWAFSGWRPRLTFSFQSLRQLGAYGGNIFGTRLLYYASENARSLLIGRFLGAAALGAYSVAYTVILVPLLRVAVPVGEVLFAAFSRMQDDTDRLTEFWLRALRLLAALVMPALAGLVIVAPDFVPLVLGEKWRGAVPVVQILAWVGLLQALDAWNGPILMALGRARTLFRSGLLFYAVFIGSYAAGLPWGIVGVASSYAISITLMQFVYQAVTTRALGVSLLAPVRAVAGVAQATAGMAVVLVAARMMLVDQGVPAVVRLVVVIALGFASYIPLCAWRAPEAFDAGMAALTSRLGRRGRTLSDRVSPPEPARP